MSKIKNQSVIKEDATKNVQKILFGKNSNALPSSLAQKNVINSIMSFLPDNRPITSLQIVENFEKCPKEYTPILRTYDQDVDADLWRENMLFSRQSTRYLCLSKTKNSNDSVLESLSVIGEKSPLPKDFCLIARTADTQQKAWRKWQLVYKLSDHSCVKEAITDIILCSKLKMAPQGFTMAGYINGILICYKTTNITTCPPVVASNSNCQSMKDEKKQLTTSMLSIGVNEANKILSRLHVNGVTDQQAQNNSRKGAAEQDFTKMCSPRRPAPKPPARKIVSTATNTSAHSVSTLGSYTELDGVPFILNPALRKIQIEQFGNLPQFSDFAMDPDLDYDFQLERQTLCTIKSPSSRNPFFK